MLDNSMKDSFDLVKYHKEHYLEKNYPTTCHQVIIRLFWHFDKMFRIFIHVLIHIFLQCYGALHVTNMSLYGVY